MFDLAIIGGGPAGYHGAEIAAKAGKKTILFEKKALGGVCLNEGCIPTKALLNSAKLFHQATEGNRLGVQVEKASLDHTMVLKHKERTVKMLVSGVATRLKAAGVQVVQAEARIQGKDGQGFVINAADQSYHAARIIIATGSNAAIPPIPGMKDAIQSGYALNSTGILNLKEIPEKLVIIGGGVIGLELGSYFADAGSKVDVVEMLPQIAGNLEPAVAAILRKSLEKRGIRFHLEATVTSVDNEGVHFEQSGQKQTLLADCVLVSVGRRPSGDGLGLENIGVTVEKGVIQTDERGRTSVEGIYAAGDVNGHSLLAHTAYREAEVCVNDILNMPDKMNYDAIPSVIYTHPEVASVGLTAGEAQSRGYDIKRVEVPLRYSGRYMAENPQGNDICVLVADKTSDRLLGVHMSGNYASEIIYGIGGMIQKGMTVREIKEIVFPHPTVGEVIREGLFEI